MISAIVVSLALVVVSSLIFTDRVLTRAKAENDDIDAAANMVPYIEVKDGARCPKCGVVTRAERPGEDDIGVVPGQGMREPRYHPYNCYTIDACNSCRNCPRDAHLHVYCLSCQAHIVMATRDADSDPPLSPSPPRPESPY